MWRLLCKNQKSVQYYRTKERIEITYSKIKSIINLISFIFFFVIR